MVCALKETSRSGLTGAYHPSGAERLKAAETVAAESGTTPAMPRSQPGSRSEPEPSLPPLKRLERYITAFFKLGRIERIAKHAARRNEVQAAEIEGLKIQNAQLETAIGTLIDQEKARDEKHAEIAAEIERMRADAAETIRRLQAVQRDQAVRFEAGLSTQAFFHTELSRRFDHMLQMLLAGSDPQKIGPQKSDPRKPDAAGGTGEVGLEVFLDAFYTLLEARYRGTPRDVQRRLRPYLVHVEAAAIRTGGKPVLDLGCGRGEWLALMKEHDIPAAGVDLSPGQLEHARRQDLDVREQGALEALEMAADDSLSVITAHHLVEHLAFEEVARITREAQRVLAPGGLLVFETPNTRNIIVGATSFHNDPTHRHPMPDPVLSTLFETAGYHPVEVLFLNPHERLEEFLARPGFDPDLAHLLFGAQDLALIGQKPMESA